MQDDTATQEMRSEEPLAKPARLSRRGSVILASVLLHLMVILPFLVHLPSRPPAVPPEESVSVEIVPPPEPEKPEPAPEPPKPEPPPPEPPPSEPPAPEPPTPEPPPQAPETQQEAPAPPVPTLRPVFRFGEQSSGPEQSAEGNSADGEKAAAEEAPKPDAEPEKAEPPEKQPEPPAPEAAAATPDPAEPAPRETAPEDAAPGDASPEDATKEAAPPVLSAEADTTPDAVPQITLPSKVAVPQPRPAPPAARAQPEPKPVKRLYSTARTGNDKATTAMGNIPRPERAGQLCASELQAQLLHGSPSYLPELLPAYRLPSGTDVLNVPRGAFRAAGVWYDISFLCTLNADATEVKAFSYAVGARVPRAEWRERGFPSF